MSRSLIICEKPSVAQDVAKALFGGAAKKAGDHWEGPDAIVAHAVGHLVEQVDPDAYDERYKKWRYEDLPILPDSFRYKARDARAAKQLKALHALMKRDDVDLIVNACDAGREGELIFKLILETAPEAARGEAGQARLVQLDDARARSATPSTRCATTRRCGRSRPRPAPAARPTGSWA